MSRLRRSGFSIVELMVTMAVGLVITLLAFTLLLSANAGHASLVDAANVDDAGRFALSAIEQAARQSGLAEWDRGVAGDPAARAPAVVGLDAASLSSDSVALNSPRPAAVNGSDVLALRFAGSGDGAVTSCAGFPVGAGDEGWSIFYVGLNGKRQPELRCKYHGSSRWTADAVVAGVDSFQLLYGLDTDTVPDGVPNRYVRASDINGLDQSLVLESATGAGRALERMRRSYWKRVATIKVALMLHGARVATSAGPSAYDLFGGSYSDAADSGTHIARDDLADAVRHRERRVFGTTIMLRNSVAAP